MRGSTRRVVASAIVALATLVLVGEGAVASASVSDRPCGRVSFDYTLQRVVAGELMDMDLGIENCSDRTERLRLRVRTSGPCAFAHPVRHTYELPPHVAVSSTSLILSPSCEGRYSVRVRLTLVRSRAVLDAASDGFSVRRT